MLSAAVSKAVVVVVAVLAKDRRLTQSRAHRAAVDAVFVKRKASMMTSTQEDDKKAKFARPL